MQPKQLHGCDIPLKKRKTTEPAPPPQRENINADHRRIVRHVFDRCFSDGGGSSQSDNLGAVLADCSDEESHSPDPRSALASSRGNGRQLGSAPIGTFARAIKEITAQAAAPNPRFKK